MGDAILKWLDAILAVFLSVATVIGIIAIVGILTIAALVKWQKGIDI